MLIRARPLEHQAVHAVDGDIGRIDDIHFDDEPRTIRHLVVTTRHRMSRKTLEQAPEHDLSRPGDRAYEQRLHDSFRRRPDWTASVAR